MENFYFPLGLWLGGLLISVIFLLAEIFIHRRRKSQTDVTMLRLEEPSLRRQNTWERWSSTSGRQRDREGAEMDLAVSENIGDIEV